MLNLRGVVFLLLNGNLRNFTVQHLVNGLLEKRLERTKMVIGTSKKTIGTIAFENGFNNISHFSRVFKSRYGNSPIDYRNSLNKK
jgi:AraC-like DNA-binding protein